MPIDREVNQYLPSLDGLRAFAVLAVLAFHSGYLSGGYLGVNIFFVLSGFLISRSLLHDVCRSGTISLREFYMRRLRRLAPAAISVVLVVGLTSPLLYEDHRLPGIRSAGFASLGYFANWRAIWREQDYWASLSQVRPLEHMWSLSVEEQVYLLWPIVLLLFVRLLSKSADPTTTMLRAAGTTAALSLTSMIWLHAGDASVARIYYGTDVRFFSVALGALVAGACNRDRFRELMSTRVVIGLVSASMTMLALAAATFTSQDSASYLASVRATEVLAALVIAMCACNSSALLSTVLARRLPRSVGKLSYSLYLWHWPVFVALDEAALIQNDLLLVGAKLILSFALALVSYRFIEQPARVGFTDRRWLAACAGALVITVTVLQLSPSAFLDRSRDQPNGVRTVAASSPAAIPDPAPATTTPSQGTSGTTGTTDSPQAVADGDADSPPSPPPLPPPSSVLVVGDSQAVELVAQASGMSFLAFNATSSGFLGCGIGPGAPTNGVQVWHTDLHGRDCAEVLMTWQASQLAQAPEAVLVHTGAWELLDSVVDGKTIRFGTPQWEELARDQIAAVNSALNNGGQRIIWLATPCYDEGDSTAQFPERLERSRVERWNEVLRDVAAADGVEVLGYDYFTCRGPYSGHRPANPDFRWDGVHLTEEGANQVWDWIAVELGAFELRALADP